MISKFEFKERSYGGVIEIELPNKTLYRITFNDSEESIKVSTVEGGMIIKPSVSNEVRISTYTK